MKFLTDLIIRGIKRFLTIQVMVFSTLLGIFAVLLVFGLFAVAITGDTETEQTTLESGVYQTVTGQDDAEITLLSIPVKGVILGESEDIGGFFSSLVEGVVYGYDIKDELAKAADDDDIDGVVLEIDSPGGTIFGSVAISEGVANYKQKTNKPVYTYVGGMAASGGYWAAASSDQIIADYGTAVGSIGVISGPFKQYNGVTSEGGLFTGTVETTKGIETNYITAGTYKDIGNPYRPMSDEEKAVLQRGVDNAYNAFVNHVSQSREIDQDQIRSNIKALIYDEWQALNYKLIDQVGSRDFAYEALASNIGSAGKSYRVVRKNSQQSFIEAITGASQHFVGNKTTKALVCEKATVLAYHGDWQRICSL